MDNSRHSFWMNPWAYTIVGGVIAAVVAAVVIGTLKATPSPSPTPTLPGQTSTPAITSPGSTSSATAAVRWHGRITINFNGIELDAKPPTTNSSSYTFALFGGATSSTLDSGNGTFAAWTGSPNPTYSQCHTWVKSNGGTSLQLTDGMDLCVLTGSGRTAYVKNISLSSNGQTAMAEAKVWTQ